MSDILARAPYRPAGYLKAILAAGQVTPDSHFIIMDDDSYIALCLRYRALGLGDRLAALLQRLGIAAAMALLQRRRWLPADCGCASRQARLNAITPRLISLLIPWRLTVSTALAWLAFALLVSRL